MTDLQENILQCHLRGMATKDIAIQLDCGVSTIYNFLRQDDIQDLLAEIKDNRAMELEQLHGKAVDVLRRNLDHPRANIQLQAVEQLRRLSPPAPTNVGAMSAEQLIETVVNQVRSLRERFNSNNAVPAQLPPASPSASTEAAPDPANVGSVPSRVDANPCGLRGVASLTSEANISIVDRTNTSD